MIKKLDITKLKRLKTKSDFNEFLDNAPLGEKVVYGYQAPPISIRCINKAINEGLISSVTMLSQSKDKSGNRIFYYIAIKIGQR
jgi:hypothetical protein